MNLVISPRRLPESELLLIDAGGGLFIISPKRLLPPIPEFGAYVTFVGLLLSPGRTPVGAND